MLGADLLDGFREKENNNENVMHNYKNLTGVWEEKRMNKKILWRFVHEVSQAEFNC